MKRNINDSAYLGDLLVTGYCFLQKQDVWKYDWEGYTVKSAMMEMSMVSGLLCHEKRL
jgi:glycerol-3-phosphate dehydrogenase (NAD(P)+)